MTFFECQPETPQPFPETTDADLHATLLDEPGLQFGDPHDSAAISADALGVDGVFVHRGRRRGSVLRLGFFIDEQSAAQSDIFGAVTVRHESEIADAVEAVGQGMKQKAADGQAIVAVLGGGRPG